MNAKYSSKAQKDKEKMELPAAGHRDVVKGGTRRQRGASSKLATSKTPVTLHQKSRIVDDYFSEVRVEGDADFDSSTDPVCDTPTPSQITSPDFPPKAFNLNSVIGSISGTISVKEKARWQIILPGTSARTIKLCAGYRHCAALTVNGQVYQWGGGNGTPSLVSNLENFNIVDVACGLGRTLCCNESGDVLGWLSEEEFRSRSSETLTFTATPLKSLAVLGAMSGNRRRIISLACGGAHTLAIMETGVVYSWGRGDRGQLGHLDFISNETPHEITTLSQNSHIAIQVAAGGSHSAIVTYGGCLFMFGSSSRGQRGRGNLRPSAVPKVLEELEKLRRRLDMKVTKVACGWNHTVCLVDRIGSKDKDNQQRWWSSVGDSDNVLSVRGRSGSGSSSAIDRELLFGIDKDTDDTTRNEMSLEWSGTEVYAWGWNRDGQLGVSSFDDEYKPCIVGFWPCPPSYSVKGTSSGLVDVVSGFNHTVVATVQGQVFTWGWGEHGQLGYSVACEATPRPVADFTLAVGTGKIACGAMHTVAVSNDGTIASWGHDGHGQCGRSGTTAVLATEAPRLSFDECQGDVLSSPLLSCSNSGEEIGPRLSFESLSLLPASIESRELLQQAELARERTHRVVIEAPSPRHLSWYDPSQIGNSYRNQTTAKEDAEWAEKIIPKLSELRGSSTLINLVRKKGIPRGMRGHVWCLCIGNALAVTPDLFSILKVHAQFLLNLNDKVTLDMSPNVAGFQDFVVRMKEAAIDVPRTLQELPCFQHQGGVFQQSVREVLQAYTCFRPDVGFIQGMSYIAAIVFLYTEDTLSAFVAFANIMQRHHFLLAFRSNRHYRYFEAWDVVFAATLPDLYICFKEANILPDMYLIEFWIPLFSRLPFQIACRMLDCYIVEGEIMLFRGVLAILSFLQQRLLDRDDPNDPPIRLLKQHISALDPLDLFGTLRDFKMPADAARAVQNVILLAQKEHA